MHTQITDTDLPRFLVCGLTGLEQSAEDVEKPTVFHCSKEKVGPRGRAGRQK
jgi:hypothetical protein